MALGGISSLIVGDTELVGSEVARLRGDLLIDNSGKIQISTNDKPPF